MIPQTKHFAPEMSEDFKSSSLKIAMNSKAFTVLSSSIYSDKVGSVVRELSCNALDSHTMQGNPDEPFLIHLPDEFEPWFSVKDFGTGMSKDTIYEVYTTYFSSTKDTTNNQVGFLGLGSKSVFSYTDSFTVTSIFDSQKTVYSVFISASGVPSISEVISEPSTERNGVEVSMSVKREDYHQFANKAKEQLRFFPVKPIVQNAPYSFLFNDPFEAEENILFFGDNFKIMKSNTGTRIIQQGPVGYPFDLHKFSSKSTNRKAIEFANKLSFSDWKIQFNIGEIGVIASREAIEYTDFTVSSIEKRLSEIEEFIKENFISQIQDSKTNWEMAIKVNALGKFGAKNSVKWLDDSAAPSVSYYGAKFNVASSNGISILECSTYHPKAYHTALIKPSDDCTFYIVDKCTYAKQRMASLRQNNTYLVHLGDKTEQDLIHLLGGYTNFKLLSQVPYSPPAKTSVKAVKTACWAFSGSVSLRSFTKFSDLPEQGKEFLYFCVDNLEFVDAADREALYKYSSLFTYNQTSVPQLFAIRKSDMKKVQDRKGAKTLAAWVQEQKDELQSYYNRYVKRSSIISAIAVDVNHRAIECLDESDDLKRMSNLKQKIRNSISNNPKFAKAQILYTGGVYQGKILEIIRDKFQKEFESRPVFKLASWYLSDMTPEQVKALAQAKVK